LLEAAPPPTLTREHTPKNKSQKVTFFSTIKTPRKAPQLHHQNTTNSPPKNHQHPPLFPKTPSKNNTKSPKSTLHRPNRLFSGKAEETCI
jgi:hypothetical protein